MNRLALATFLLVGGKVFLQTASADGKTRTLLCFRSLEERGRQLKNSAGVIIFVGNET
ncbi:hypothetical protein J8F10_37520 [Gemmata sp. G18]|uniref:Uncharacterized protein n=1 Tax=Gemmata palustris TaxID=2822762 RepID=A0ABS5C4L3_9BACT|nr:hypothetical protein [Gemmata palustris]MBP3960956.1 hypothetical protein [Gemmata palustris]